MLPTINPSPRMSSLDLMMKKYVTARGYGLRRTLQRHCKILIVLHQDGPMELFEVALRMCLAHPTLYNYVREMVCSGMVKFDNEKRYSVTRAGYKILGIKGDEDELDEYKNISTSRGTLWTHKKIKSNNSIEEINMDEEDLRRLSEACQIALNDDAKGAIDEEGSQYDFVITMIKRDHDEDPTNQ